MLLVLGLALAVVVLAGVVGLVTYLSVGGDEPTPPGAASRVAPVANVDHWHVAYGVSACGRWLPAVSTTTDPEGIHTHGEGVIHVHPFSSAAAGEHATIGRFAAAIGASVDPADFRWPDGPGTLRATGTTCDGRPATLVAFVDGERRPGDPARIRLTDNGVVVLAVVPEGTTYQDIGDPPSKATLRRLGDVAPATTAPGAPLGCAAADGSAPRTTALPAEPPLSCLHPARTYRASVLTDAGTFVIALDPTRSPRAVNSFVELARRHLYDGLTFHRAVPGFVVQGGDPAGDGTGGAGYSLPDELGRAPYQDGTVALANAGPDTASSQFFVVLGPAGRGLRPDSTVIGKVVTGLEVVAAIQADGSPESATGGPPRRLHRILRIEIEET